MWGAVFRKAKTPATFMYLTRLELEPHQSKKPSTTFFAILLKLFKVVCIDCDLWSLHNSIRGRVSGESTGGPKPWPADRDKIEYYFPQGFFHIQKITIWKL